jgi:hypothetical protein
MKAEQFRIGNYLHDREGRLCRVQAIVFDKQEGHTIEAPALDGPQTSLPHKPIKINSELLLKFGVKNNLVKVYFEKNGFRLEYLDKKWRCFYNGSYIIELEYIHSFQNLVFALTGKELIYSG